MQKLNLVRFYLQDCLNLAEIGFSVVMVLLEEVWFALIYALSYGQIRLRRVPKEINPAGYGAIVFNVLLAVWLIGYEKVAVLTFVVLAVGYLVWKVFEDSWCYPHNVPPQ